jgi:delta 1-pyrroline-5-carboxylate dehydrogenase
MSTSYDILLDANGDLPKVTTHVRGWLVVVQRVNFRLATFEGEWILDTAAGLPYLTWRAQKSPNLGEIGAKIQRDILATPGVIRLVSFAGEFILDEQRVRFDIELEVEDIAGETAVAEIEFFPFGATTANTNPIALYTAPSKTVL